VRLLDHQIPIKPVQDPLYDEFVYIVKVPAIMNVSIAEVFCALAGMITDQAPLPGWKFIPPRYFNSVDDEKIYNLMRRLDAFRWSSIKSVEKRNMELVDIVMGRAFFLDGGESITLADLTNNIFVLVADIGKYFAKRKEQIEDTRRNLKKERPQFTKAIS
jgi:hypothetical protein